MAGVKSSMALLRFCHFAFASKALTLPRLLMAPLRSRVDQGVWQWCLKMHRLLLMRRLVRLQLPHIHHDDQFQY